VKSVKPPEGWLDDPPLAAKKLTTFRIDSYSPVDVSATGR
jgi:hypothetical protein